MGNDAFSLLPVVAQRLKADSISTARKSIMPSHAREPVTETDRTLGPLWERACSGIELGSCDLPVRRCASSDIRQLAPLTYAAFADTVGSAPLELWTGKISSIINGRYGTFLSTASLVAEMPSGQFVGTVLTTDFPLYQAPVIALIAVDPCVQGRGLGSYLLRRCINALSLEGFTLCRARISCGNDASQRLFRKTDFQLRLR